MEPANSLAQKWSELVETYNGGALQHDEAVVYIAVVASMVASVISREATVENLRAVARQLSKFSTVVDGADCSRGRFLKDGTFVPPQPWPGVDPSSTSRKEANAIAEEVRRASWYQWLCERSVKEVEVQPGERQDPLHLRAAFLRRVDSHNAKAAADMSGDGVCLDVASDFNGWLTPG